MRTTALLLTLTIFAPGCDSAKEASAEGAAKAQAADGDNAAAAAKIDYTAVDAKIKAAKTGEDWTNALMACGQLEIDGAMNGQPKLGDDPEFNKHCGVGFEMARAKQVVEVSTPDKMHEGCISASMGMEGLIEQGKAVADAKAMLAKVNAACGI